MDNYIEITSLEEFKNAVDGFATVIPKIEEVFASENKIFTEIEASNSWNSEAQKKMCDKYTVIKNNYDSVITSLNSYLALAQTAYTEYKKRDDLMNEELNKNSGAYNV